MKDTTVFSIFNCLINYIKNDLLNLPEFECLAKFFRILWRVCENAGKWKLVTSVGILNAVHLDSRMKNTKTDGVCVLINPIPASEE